MGALLDYANRGAGPSLPMERVSYGPWKGSMRSVAADAVPPEYIAGGNDFLYLPRSGHWKRRRGQTQKFDTFGSSAGLLPAKWSSRARWMEEFVSECIADGVPSLIALATREYIATGLDDGRFSQVWVRDQVNNLNYTVGSEFSDSTYPEPGTVQTLRFVPLWYDSGDGGITRGATEFARRFFFGGSRRFFKSGNWWYFPSLLGTPSRWNGCKGTSSAAQTLLPVTVKDSADGWDSNFGVVDGIGGSNYGLALQTADGDTTFIQSGDGSTPGGIDTRHEHSIAQPVAPGTFAGWTLTIVARKTSAGACADDTIFGWYGRVWNGSVFSGGTQLTSLTQASTWLKAQLTTSYQTFTIPISTTDAALIMTPISGNTRFTMEFVFDGTTAGSEADNVVNITQIALNVPGVADDVNRLIPSGPLPPTHAGVLVRGNPVAGSTNDTMRPDADISDGSWTDSSAGTNLFAQLDETTVNDADYITSPGTGGTVCRIGLSNPAVTPISTDIVTVHFRGKRGGLLTPTLLMQINDGVTTHASSTVLLSAGFVTYSRQLTSTEIAAITAGAGWNALEIRFTASGAGSTALVSYVDITIAPAGTTEGGWLGSDRFFYSVAYRFEDDSIWMPCFPRFPNATMASGYNLFTISSDNPTTTFDKVQWTNIPIGPHGVISRLLLRTPKIDSTADDNLQLNPFDLRVVAEITDNVSTTYDDYFADDESLTFDPEGFFIRYDHIMPPRSRYNFAGDLRACHSYGGVNPCAIIIAPIGRTADYDLNVNDGATTGYANTGAYMRIVVGDGSGDGIEFVKDSGSAGRLTFSAYPTLQDLVDRINIMNFADLGGQWRAQLCPGVNPQAPTATCLTPHARTITSCVVSGQTITKPAGGLALVPVGHEITGTGVTAGAYVSRIDSDTQLTFVGTITAGTKSLTFYSELGDSPDGITTLGWQRVIANSLPGFLFFNEDYLDDYPLDKQATWMTVASPGSVKSAPNCFSGKIANKHVPPIEAGIAMGGAGVDQGFVTLYANKVGAIKNTRDSSSGIDQDYRLIIIDDSRGCCAWNTVVPGNRFVPFMSGEGIFAADLERVVFLSEAIFSHAPTATGDFSFEAPLCVAATARDIDRDVSDSTITAYASARIMRGCLWISYRVSGSHPNRMVCFDFSSGMEGNGLEALFRARGEPWGWSVPLIRSVTAMAEGRRSDGLHLYGWNDENAGSTGDGRVDEIETSDTDNGTAIDGKVETPWLSFGDDTKLSAQDFQVRHNAAAGSTGQYIFHRGLADGDQYTLTPSTGTDIYQQDFKMLTLPARTPTAACFFGYRQQTGAARELRKITLRLKKLLKYR